MSLVEFLRARLDEDERAAQAGLHSDVVAMVARQSGKKNALNFWHRHDPARVLAEVESKRRIVELYERRVESMKPYPNQGNANAMAALYEVLRALGLPHADHPDYDQSWKP